jgi:ubiquinone/menaquinone biosynthesis C-methylase UbiE
MKIINAPIIEKTNAQKKFLKNPSWEKNFFEKGFYTKGGDESKEGFLPEKTQSYYERTQKEVDGLWNILKLQKGQSLLDVPCGAGRHIFELQKRGIEVSGVEIHPDQISCAPLEVKSKITQGSMYHLPFKNSSFDSVTNMFFSFGFSEKHAENIRFLQEAYRVLKPGGKFLLHTDVVIFEDENGDWVFPDWYQFDEHRSLTDGRNLHIQEKVCQCEENMTRLIGSWTIGGKTVPYSMQIFSDQEYKRLFESIGFYSVQIFSNWKKEVFPAGVPQEMIVVGEK